MFTANSYLVHLPRPTHHMWPSPCFVREREAVWRRGERNGDGHKRFFLLYCHFSWDKERDSTLAARGSETANVAGVWVILFLYSYCATGGFGWFVEGVERRGRVQKRSILFINCQGALTCNIHTLRGARPSRFPTANLCHNTEDRGETVQIRDGINLFWPTVTRSQYLLSPNHRIHFK